MVLDRRGGIDRVPVRMSPTQARELAAELLAQAEGVALPPERSSEFPSAPVSVISAVDQAIRTLLGHGDVVTLDTVYSRVRLRSGEYQELVRFAFAIALAERLRTSYLARSSASPTTKRERRTRGSSAGIRTAH
jgi:hypothetical protein